jgi:urea transport system permease protein
MLLAAGIARAAPDAAQLAALANGSNDEKIAALRDLGAQADAASLPVLAALSEGSLYAFKTDSGWRVLLLKASGEAVDAASGERLLSLPEGADSVMINNRVRGALAAALAAIRLASADVEMRLEAIATLGNAPDVKFLPLLDAALRRESNENVKTRIETVRAVILLQNGQREDRLMAIRILGETSDPAHLRLLRPFLTKDGQGRFVETDTRIRAAARQAAREIESRVQTGEMLKRVFEGISLGSILLLAALGLAIAYGLMGVINMAHGELVMIGAYAAYVTQTLVQQHAPAFFDVWLLAAIPVSFFAAAFAGFLMERLVIRHLYGRPLETLLATWGISLMLIQGVRAFFGAQNVTVENPSWLSGGVEIIGKQILTYNRIALIVFAALVLAGVVVLLAGTRMGLFVRAVTQNRAIARCMGVSTGYVDSMTFGFGAGLAGLAGCALSQIGNVGPELGQGYIVDSFMVVVLGGVGQIAGTVYAALGLGILNKFIEAFAGAVLAKIAILLMIVIFIQKRPQGIFALKGRYADI